MSRINTIQDIINAEVQLIRNQSELLLQKKKNGQNGELKTSGYLVESYVKELIKKHIPENYRVCSGYIATTETINSFIRYIHPFTHVCNYRLGLYRNFTKKNGHF